MLTNGELFDLRENLESRVDRYWSFYSIVILAVGGWLFTGKYLSLSDAPFVVIGLLVFLAANFSVITQTEARIEAVESEIEARSQKAEILSTLFRRRLAQLSIPRRRLLSAVLHATVDLAVLVLVFAKAA